MDYNIQSLSATDLLRRGAEQLSKEQQDLFDEFGSDKKIDWTDPANSMKIQAQLARVSGGMQALSNTFKALTNATQGIIANLRP